MSAKKPPELKSIKEILDDENKFYVAAYQRGYRWTSVEVELLIDDICLFAQDEHKKEIAKRCPFYSLQALIVKENDGKLEVIDGQQRLTTMLIILQTLYIVNNKKMLNLMLENEKYDDLILEKKYSIKYETREESESWLKEITKAFLLDTKNENDEEKNKLKKMNSDYHHFVEALLCAFRKISNMSDKDRNEFSGILQEEVRFIWYDITEDDSCKEVDVFDRINATQIGLNNAELIKALFLQKSVFEEHSFERNQMAVEWDELEKRLQNPLFWYFIYSQNNSGYIYETHIEYLFDLIKGKKRTDKDNYYYTFNAYYSEFLKADRKYTYVKHAWDEIQEMYSLLEEWYNDKECYHYIGYLIEYGRDEESQPINIPYLRNTLKVLPKTKVHEKLVELIKMSLKDIKSTQLVHGKPELTQFLFLFNIETEQQRTNKMARFSFSDYKTIKEKPGWNQEHIASNVDYQTDMDKRIDLAVDLLEYFTGILGDKAKLKGNDESYKKEFIDKIDEELPKSSDEKDLCEKVLLLLDSTMTDSKLSDIYSSIMVYFESNKPLEEVVLNKKTISEKDFIWNFVLLNEHTNKSYGNNIFPVKRRRILKDEFGIYTPITTRFVFEKSYSKRLTEMIKWGRDDALAYWNEMCTKLKVFLPEDFALPNYIKV